MITEKILRVGEIIKSNTSYGNYSFKIEVLRSGLNGLYKTERSIFEFYLKDIQNKRKEYLSLINKDKEFLINSVCEY